MPPQSPSPGRLPGLWMWLVLIMISGTLSSSKMSQMRTTQLQSPVLTVPISLRQSTPSLLTTSVLVMCTISLSHHSMELARERAEPLNIEVGLCMCVCHVDVVIYNVLFAGISFERKNITYIDGGTCSVTFKLVCVSPLGIQ